MVKVTFKLNGDSIFKELTFSRRYGLYIALVSAKDEPVTINGRRFCLESITATEKEFTANLSEI